MSHRPGARTVDRIERGSVTRNGRHGSMLFLAVVCLSCLVSGCSLLGGGRERASTIEEVVEPYVAKFVHADGPGLAIAVTRDDSVLFEEGYGLADIGAGLAVDRATRFYLASVSKQITATAVLLLHENGSLSLDDRVVDTFPEAPVSWSEIAVHHLLTHQSGLTEYLELPERAGWTNQDVLDFAVQTDPEFAPGTRFRYSNTGYVVLAVLVERIAGVPFQTFVRTRIFEPLGMDQSVVADPSRPPIPLRALGYWSDGQLHDYPLMTMGDGGIFASLRDMEVWAMAELDAELLSPETLALAFTSHEDRGYGYGWFVDRYERRKRVYHSGALVGYAARIALIPEEDLAVVVLSNGTFREEVPELADRVLSFYLSK